MSKFNFLVDILTIACKYVPIETQAVAYFPTDFLKGGNFFLYEAMCAGMEARHSL